MLPELFYTINFSLTIIGAIIGLIFAFLIIIIILINRECHTVANLLICNTIVVSISFNIILLLSNSFGLRQDWLEYQPACFIRGYILITLCGVSSYSYLIQAISRLFFAVLYKYKSLQTYRIHWFMIVICWTVGSIVPGIMYGIDHNVFMLQKESRFCIATSDSFPPSIYSMISGYVIPVNIITIIYGIIVRHARQSARRVVAFAPRSTTSIVISMTNTMPNMKRELRMMKNIMTLLSCSIFAGTPYLILVLWRVVFQTSPPEPLYLLSLNSIAIAAEFMTIMTLFMCKDVKKYFYGYLKKLKEKVT